jgi:hypothetical protein
MTTKLQDVEADLAFMKALVDGPTMSWAAFGETYLAGGLIYGVECLFHFAQYEGWIILPPALSMAVAVGFTAVFLAILAWLLWRRRGATPLGTANRAIRSMFTAVGITNIVMVALFAMVATRHHSVTIWMIYPTIVFALQGAAWLVTAMLRRRPWMGAIAAGWYVSALWLGLTIDTVAYLAVCGFSLLLWMALPGALMLRQARVAA